MATITLHHGLPGYDWFALLSAAFGTGTLASSIENAATLTVANYDGGGLDLLVVFSGSDIAVAADLFTAGVISQIELSLGGESVAIATYDAATVPWEDLNVPLQLFDGPTPTQQQVLDALDVALFQDHTTINGSTDGELLLAPLLVQATDEGGLFNRLVGNGGNDTLIGGGDDDDVFGGTGMIGSTQAQATSTISMPARVRTRFMAAPVSTS